MNKLLLLLVFLVISCSQIGNETSKEELTNWEDWKSTRMSNLKSPEGFLNLAGLYWLKEGDNTFGSDSTNGIQFPDDLPRIIGNFQLNDKIVSILNPVDGLSIDSLTATETIVFNQDSSINKILEYGTYRWYIIERAGDIGIRLKNLDHPNLKKNIDINFFDYNSVYDVQANFLPYSVPKKLKIINVLGHEFEMTISGQLSFEIAGNSYTLEPLDDGDDFFIIFSDGTSAIETYGSGRYMDAKKPLPGEKVELNFNQAYNPPCAFTDFATCLIPPPENQLDLRIEAGEYDYHMDSH